MGGIRDGRGCELFADEGSHVSPQDFDGTQPLRMRKSRDTHLEGEAGDAAKDFLHIGNFLPDGFSVPDRQRARRSALGHPSVLA